MSEMPLGLGSEQLWRWSTGISIPESERAFSFSSHLFDAPVLCFAITLVLLILRLLIMRIRKVSISGTMVSLMDRALSRVIGTALVFAALGILWLAGCWLNYTKWGHRCRLEARSPPAELSPCCGTGWGEWGRQKREASWTS